MRLWDHQTIFVSINSNRQMPISKNLVFHTTVSDMENKQLRYPKTQK